MHGVVYCGAATTSLLHVSMQLLKKGGRRDCVEDFFYSTIQIPETQTWLWYDISILVSGTRYRKAHTGKCTTVVYNNMLQMQKQLDVCQESGHVAGGNVLPLTSSDSLRTCSVDKHSLLSQPLCT